MLLELKLNKLKLVTYLPTEVGYVGQIKLQHRADGINSCDTENDKLG